METFPCLHIPCRAKWEYPPQAVMLGQPTVEEPT